ncbi:monocarboxylate permease-like protein [Aspergillus affinis]|uniref:monocarboxylate permease-like protein n=1 Tax=Aspergillus affinis TaxID=1070780 RepID=UPI0022FEBA53|nr:monocarboxylate permease-like protein [Aspergillus affinis]KAI9041921.1 monocarboxylate permease-like protein [Aspergillus affinis]
MVGYLLIFIGFGRCSMWDETVRFANISMTRTKKAQIRIAQPNSTRGIKCWTMRGNTTPPVEDPATVSPEVIAFLLRNQVYGWETVNKPTTTLDVSERGVGEGGRAAPIYVFLTAAMAGVKMRAHPSPEQTDWLSMN